MPETDLGLLILPSHDARRILALGRRADRAAFDYVWIPDERFYREPYELLAVLASKTRRVRLGPCVADPYTRHPTLTAVAIATLDELSNGRAILGMGAGISGFTELGLRHSPPPVPAVRSAVSQIRQHLREAPRSAGAAGIDFVPQRASLPIYLAAERPGMLRLAGQMADGVILQAKVAPALFHAALDRVSRAASDAGRTLQVVSRVDVSVAPDIQVAYEALRPRVARRLIGSAPEFDPFRIAGLDIPVELAQRARRTRYTNEHHVLADLGRSISDTMVDAFCIAATPERLGQRLTDLAAEGADQILVHPVPNESGGIESIIDLAGAWRAARHDSASAS